MTIEEAIQHCKETALSNAACGEAYRKGGQTMLADGCEACAAEHAQLAAWLEELQEKRCKVIVQANRIKELEGELKEELAKREEAYDKLWAAYARIDELVRKAEGAKQE